MLFLYRRGNEKENPMKFRWLFLAFALLGLPAIANAQKTCTPLTATSQNCVVTLTWAITGVDATHPAPTSFQLRRGDGGGPKSVIGTVNAPTMLLQNTFTDSGGVDHCWDAVSILGPASSVASTQACWTSPAIVVQGPLVPPTPSGFTVSSVSSGTIELSWATTDMAEAYKWERRKGNQPKLIEKTGTVLAAITSYRDSYLRRATTYCYDVAAINVSGISGATPVLCATTRP
jgi:hypothetical protein